MAFSHMQQLKLNKLWQEQQESVTFEGFLDEQQEYVTYKSRRINLLIKYALPKFKESFLLLYELPILWCAGIAPVFVVFDFKNHCNEELLMSLRTPTEGIHPANCGTGVTMKEPEIICNVPSMGSEEARRLAGEIEQLESCKAEGLRFEPLEQSDNLATMDKTEFTTCQERCNSRRRGHLS